MNVRFVQCKKWQREHLVKEDGELIKQNEAETETEHRERETVAELLLHLETIQKNRDSGLSRRYLGSSRAVRRIGRMSLILHKYNTNTAWLFSAYLYIFSLSFSLTHSDPSSRESWLKQQSKQGGAKHCKDCSLLHFPSQNLPSFLSIVVDYRSPETLGSVPVLSVLFLCLIKSTQGF